LALVPNRSRLYPSALAVFAPGSRWLVIGITLQKFYEKIYLIGAGLIGLFMLGWWGFLKV
jgi:hypothetical protein